MLCGARDAALAAIDAPEGRAEEMSPGCVAATHYPPGMGEESRRLHREYNRLVAAQRAGAKNGPEVVALAYEAAEKGIILVSGGENL